MLQIWDTAGQEQFRTLASVFYKGSDACVLVYDINNKSSFESIETWKQEFLKMGGISPNDDFPFIVLGSKADKNDRQVE